MIAAAAKPKVATVDIVEVFKLRCEGRALLWSMGEYTLDDAERDGLLEQLGQDEVQRIMADAFRPFREAR
jgi:hypothetical protein